MNNPLADEVYIWTKKLQAGDDEAPNKLIELLHKLVSKQAWDWCKGHPIDDIEDIESLAQCTLCKVVNKLKGVKSNAFSISGYVMQSVTNALINECNKNRKYVNNIEDHSVFTSEYIMDDDESIDDIIKDWHLNVNERKVLSLRLDGKTYEEISNIFGVTKQMIGHIIIDIRNKIKEK